MGESLAVTQLDKSYNRIARQQTPIHHEPGTRSVKVISYYCGAAMCGEKAIRDFFLAPAT